MKTNSFILGAAALMLATSCSNDEVVQVAENSQAIGFSSFVNKSTRATDVTASNLTNFNVYGVTTGGNNVSSIIFNGNESTKGNANEEGTVIWTYSGDTQYWINNFNYTFAAVAPANATGVTVTQSAGTANGGISSINFVNNGQLDLLFDAQEVAVGSTYWGKVVPFDLKHILSRAQFKFTNSVNDDYKVVVRDIKFTNAHNEATYTPAETAAETAGTWSTTETKSTLNFTEENLSIEYNGNATTLPTYLIPVAQGEGEGFNVEFTVDLYIKDAASGNYTSTPNDTYTLTATLSNMTFAQGYSYAFSTNLTWENVIDDEKKPIEFTVESVATWNGLNDEAVNADSEKKESPAEEGGETPTV